VLIVKPKVGDISVTSSPMIDLTIVVLPELSSPLDIKIINTVLTDEFVFLIT